MAKKRTRSRPSLAVLKQLAERFWTLREPSSSHKHLSDIKQLRPLKRPPLSSVYPDICEDWLDELNLGYSPDDFNHYSSFMAWWICPNGPDHVFEHAIAAQVQAYRDDSSMRGCPFCRGFLPSVTNNIAELFPEIAKEWDEKRNGKSADLVVYGSNEKAWFICSKNKHRWNTNICDRTLSGAGCPHCLYEWIDLKNYPLAWKQFDRTKNRDVNPRRLPLTLKVWWRCQKAADHVWQSSFSRTNGIRCQYCRGKKASSTNNLTMRKDLLEQFHPTKNEGLTPKDIPLGSHLIVWWKCPVAKDHEWPASVSNRTHRGDGCPYCGNRLLTFSNSLMGGYPNLVSELHPTKNRRFRPEKVIASSKEKVWWRGPCGHEWLQSIRSRTLEGHGCTVCWTELRRERMRAIGKSKRKHA